MKNSFEDHLTGGFVVLAAVLLMIFLAGCAVLPCVLSYGFLQWVTR